MAQRSFAHPAILVATLAGWFASAPCALSAQVTGSERATFTQSVSGTEIVIDYARPSVRGREVLFGGQVPWGEVWTPGANEATTLHVSKDVTLNGVDVPAGTYSVWMQVLESEPWIFVLHPDTTLFHTQHPSVDEGVVRLPVELEQGTEFAETLTFDIDAIRADRAVLRFRWGLHRVSLDLGVDPGFVFTVEETEARRYEGEWSVDRSMSAPSDSLAAEWRAGMTPEQLEMFEDYLASLAEPSTVRVVYDVDGQRLLAYDAVAAEMMGESPDLPQYQLVPRAEGIFYPGLLINGELAFVNDFSLWEFELGPDGLVERFVDRANDDSVRGVGTKVR